MGSPGFGGLEVVGGLLLLVEGDTQTFPIEVVDRSRLVDARGRDCCKHETFRH